MHQEVSVFADPNDEALRNVWRSRAPDYLIEGSPIIDRIAASAGGTRARFQIHGLEYRVIKQFPIGKDVEWTLAERTIPPAATPKQ